MLDQLDALLREAARTRQPLTYQEAALLLEFAGPQTIHRLTELLETLMRRHAATGIPQYSCFVVARGRGGLPAPGFFMLLGELGLYRGSVDGDDAHAYIAAERQRCFDHGAL